MKTKRKLKPKAIVLLGMVTILTFSIVILAPKQIHNFIEDHIDNITKESAFPENVYGIPVITDLIEESTARPMTLRKIKYIVIHETDNFAPSAGAHNHAIYLKNNNESTTSWHYTVDDHEIYHHIPDNEIAHHAGDVKGNLYGIGIELCVNEDGDFEATFDNAAKLVAYLLKEYHLKIDAIKTHHDFTGKDCPNHILEDNRLEEFKNRVKYYQKSEKIAKN